MIHYGGSPRASTNLALAAKAMAFIRRRVYVIPDDIRALPWMYCVTESASLMRQRQRVSPENQS
ncbi:hypothetical protein [Candidatus Brachybacter algidus]|uniref:hypothetical protein n=1 Tax=Candidatus Brachybacter algidus TaxID=2982024 RepID=UPI00257D9630|nr:hypothetical protein [Candidatus Brachybacter algidus]